MNHVCGRKTISKESREYFSDEEWKAYKLIDDFESKCCLISMRMKNYISIH